MYMLRGESLGTRLVSAQVSYIIVTLPQTFNPFTTRVPIGIGLSFTLVYELSGSNEVHTKPD